MSTKKFNSKSVIALACIAIAVVWMYLGITKYGLWDPKEGPLSGFFPTIIGGVLLISSVIYFIRSFSMEGAKYEKGAIQLTIGMLVIFGASYLIGFLPTLLLFYIFWLRVMEKMPVRTIIIATVVMTAIVYGTFSMWLKVPFPEGLLFEMILG
ncbi:tripartite tricarboxylate transporter TctB family protein [Dysosmobacter sp.]|uniref:tripartite tricarboxylate transporter TctB family protein n=1 Tax=Dysosmobacter sp. TaxID=2591382 RepID=UPI002A93BFB1|nr:tripartite tricarboxylate transporter TctB family protein [Dysosmobacter sp.]MDY5613033.1 tripartite tricarboxylate transporter TctB family protein [Dysosmobacter sp.]